MLNTSLEAFQKTQIIISTLMGAIVVGVAILQYRVSREQKNVASQKLRLDLFDKRYAILERMREFIAHVISKGGADHSEVRKLHLSVYGGEFLFGEDLSSYISEFLERSRKLNAATSALMGELNAEDRVSFAKEQGIQVAWFVSQYNKIGANFRPYLHMSQKS